MVITWQVPELGADFSQDFEDIIIQYVYDQWSISNPGKGATMRPNTETEPDKVHFKPGFPDFFVPYEIAMVQTRTTPLEKIGGKFVFSTGLDTMIRMKRIERDGIAEDIQLENMEVEVQRIIEHYIPNSIVGIKDLIYDDNISTEKVYRARDSYAKSDWRTVVHIKVFYEKEDSS
jgi:hypothetical protein